MEKKQVIALYSFVNNGIPHCYGGNYIFSLYIKGMYINNYKMLLSRYKGLLNRKSMFLLKGMANGRCPRFNRTCT